MCNRMHDYVMQFYSVKAKYNSIHDFNLSFSTYKSFLFSDFMVRYKVIIHAVKIIK